MTQRSDHCAPFSANLRLLPAAEPAGISESDGIDAELHAISITLRTPARLEPAGAARVAACLERRFRSGD